MMYELKGKVILITGAATGIGSKVVQIAVAEEAKVNLSRISTNTSLLITNTS